MPTGALYRSGGGVCQSGRSRLFQDAQEQRRGGPRFSRRSSSADHRPPDAGRGPRHPFCRRPFHRCCRCGDRPSYFEALFKSVRLGESGRWSSGAATCIRWSSAIPRPGRGQPHSMATIPSCATSGSRRAARRARIQGAGRWYRAGLWLSVLEKLSVLRPRRVVRNRMSRRPGAGVSCLSPCSAACCSSAWVAVVVGLYRSQRREHGRRQDLLRNDERLNSAQRICATRELGDRTAEHERPLFGRAVPHFRTSRPLRPAAKYDDFMARVHPEDRDNTHQVLMDAIATRQPGLC